MKSERITDKASKSHGRTRCPICGKAIGSSGAHLHEVFFKRSDIPRRHGQEYAFDPRNTVTVHGGICHLEAHTKNGKIKCVAYLVQMYGYNAVKDYILSAPIKSQSTLNKALYVLEECKNA